MLLAQYKPLLRGVFYMEVSKQYFAITTERDPLNIRSGPGKHHSKLGSLPSGVIVRGELSNGWLRTTLQGETCYLSADYLKPLDPSCVLCYTGDDIIEVIHWLGGLL